MFSCVNRMEVGVGTLCRIGFFDEDPNADLEDSMRGGQFSACAMPIGPFDKARQKTLHVVVRNGLANFDQGIKLG